MSLSNKNLNINVDLSESKSGALPQAPLQNENKGFRRFENKVSEEDRRAWTEEALGAKETLRIQDFANHEALIVTASKCSLGQIKASNSYKECQPLRYPYAGFSEYSGLPTHLLRTNIFNAIFLENEVMTAQEKIELAEHLIQDLGYIDYLIVLFHPSNKLTLLALLKDVNYLDFLQRIYIKLLREGEIFDRADHFEIEQQILSAVVTHHEDGGLTLFENFTANQNISEEKLKRFLNRCCLDHFSWPETLVSLGMEAFLRKVLFYGKVSKRNAEQGQVIARDPIAHANYLQELAPENPKPEDLSSLYAYFKIYFAQFKEYEQVKEACLALTKQWAAFLDEGGPRYQGLRDTAAWGIERIKGVIKKYADLRILEIAQDKANLEGNVDRTVPENIKTFLNPKNKITFFMSSRSAYKLISAFFADPIASKIILDQKRARIEKRFLVSDSPSLHARKG